MTSEHGAARTADAPRAGSGAGADSGGNADRAGQQGAPVRDLLHDPTDNGTNDRASHGASEPASNAASDGANDRAGDGTTDRAPVDAVLLLGPTASGKSELALALAREIELEIVSIDSAQVYRGLDIGTAKPDRAQRAAVPHHLIDIRDPAQPYSAAEFVRDASVAIGAIRARGRLPLVVGGTMLYARALLTGLSDLPPADARVRARLSAEARERGWPALHARLAQQDPAIAARLAPKDSQRIARALEVLELRGVPLSQLQSRPARPALALRTIVLLPDDRAELHRRIGARFDAMLAAGFLDEVRTLRARGDLQADLPALRSVGYRQAWAHLEGASSFAQFRAAGIAATRQLAKRQITWLRSMPAAVSIDPLRSLGDGRPVLDLLRPHLRLDGRVTP